MTQRSSASSLRTRLYAGDTRAPGSRPRAASAELRGWLLVAEDLRDLREVARGEPQLAGSSEHRVGRTHGCHVDVDVAGQLEHEPEILPTWSAAGRVASSLAPAVSAMAVSPSVQGSDLARPMESAARKEGAGYEEGHPSRCRWWRCLAPARGTPRRSRPGVARAPSASARVATRAGASAARSRREPRPSSRRDEVVPRSPCSGSRGR